MLTIENDYSRCFTVAGLPRQIRGTPNELERLEITVQYTGESSIHKATPLDNVIVPLFKASPALLEAATRFIQFGKEGGDTSWQSEAAQSFFYDLMVAIGQATDKAKV